MSIVDRQRNHLAGVIRWAKEIHKHLQPVLDAHRGQVHFRPSSGGVAMVGLIPERPQRGKSGIRDLERLAADFDAEFRKHCIEIEQGRSTAEKALQSWLIAEAYRSKRQLVSLNHASEATPSPVALVFVTDEIAIPTTADRRGRIVCDILACRVFVDRVVPVAIELKTERQLTRLVEQVTKYAALVDEHTDVFTELFSATLGAPVGTMDGCEKWIVWPLAGDRRDPCEEQLAKAGIRVAGYEATVDGYGFRIGREPRR
jgi:hypothetical protein